MARISTGPMKRRGWKRCTSLLRQMEASAQIDHTQSSRRPVRNGGQMRRASRSTGENGALGPSTLEPPVSGRGSCVRASGPHADDVTGDRDLCPAAVEAWLYDSADGGAWRDPGQQHWRHERTHPAKPPSVQRRDPPTGYERKGDRCDRSPFRVQSASLEVDVHHTWT